jgi:DNA-binding NarL/FixJ family response regulator
MERTVPDVIVGDFTGFSVGAAANSSELVRTLRSEGYRTPLIVFSYDDEKELFAEVLKSGAIGFVEKSGDPSAVYSTLKSRTVSMTREL